METEILDKLARIEQFTMLGAKQALTMDDAALLMGLSKSTLYKMVCQKKIPYYKSQRGKCIYFERESLNNWMLNVSVDAIGEAAQEDLPHIQVFVDGKEVRLCLSLIIQGLLFCLKMLYLCSG